MTDREQPALAATAERRRPAMFDAGLAFLLALALASAALVYHLFGLQEVLGVLAEDSGLLLSVAPRVAAGVILASFLGLLLPREKIGRQFGRGSGLRGLALASAAGVAVPGGPGVVLPLSASFSASGADRGCIAAFLTSWMLLGINRVLVWEISFFDPEFVLIRVLTSLPAPIVVGILVRIALDRGAGAADRR
jgi:uncharacterized membrane protein YraQ (UPF0718 family)